MKGVRWPSCDERPFVHRKSLERFGGVEGVRDPALLEAAFNRARHLAVDEPDASIPRLAAAHTFRLVRNHRFVDGNKRVGFAADLPFLDMNGWRFIASNKEAEVIVLALAAGETEEADDADFLTRNVEPS